MSQVNKNWFYWSAQVLGWTLYSLVIFVLTYLLGGIILTASLVLYFILSLIFLIFITHLLRFFIIKYNWLNQSIWQIIYKSIIGSLLAAIFFEFFQYVYTDLIVNKDFLVDDTKELTLTRFFISVLFTFFLFSLWYSFYYTYLFIEKSRNQEIKNLQYEASKNEIELKNLRAQINPHFLFNSLNSIKALVEIDKDEAKTAITQLSNLLRLSIHLSKSKLISLKEEMELVDTYLKLEKIRFEERVKYHYSIENETTFCMIPPLMIQTLVENAIKHGLSKSIDGGEIFITTKKNKENLLIEIKNTGILTERDEDESEGIGIKNTQKRLAILFGEKATFKIEQKGKFVVVSIKISCQN